MRIRDIHPWDLSPREAIGLQKRLARRLRIEPLRHLPRLVAGADASYFKRGDLFFGGVCVLRLPSMEVVEETVAVDRVEFPYVPGLLSFREAPLLLEAFRRLRHPPDAVIFDGQGTAHPRRLGLASHVGLFLGIPTVGCAKSRLVGEHGEPADRIGSRRALRLEGRTVGAALRTRKGVKPVFVSPGHRIDQEGAVRLVLRCLRGLRLPEPTRRAHILVNRARREHGGMD